MAGWPFAVHVLPRRGPADGGRPRRRARTAGITSRCAATPTSPTSACSRRRSATSSSTSTTSTRRSTGPFEWDLKRLATSLVVAGAVTWLHRAPEPPRACTAASARTATRMAEYARCARSRSTTLGSTRRAILAFVEQAGAAVSSKSTVKSAAHHDALHELPEADRGRPTASAGSSTDPPIIVHRPESRPRSSRRRSSSYRETLAGGPARAARPLRDRRRRDEGGRRRERRVSARSSRCSTAARTTTRSSSRSSRPRPPSTSVPRPSAPAEPRRARRRRPAPAPGRQRHPARLGRRRPQGRHWYVRQLQDQKAGAVVEAMTDRRPDDLGRAVRLGPRPRPRPVGRAGDDRRLPRRRRRVRRRDRRVRRGLRRPDRTRLRGVHRGDQVRPDHRRDRASDDSRRGVRRRPRPAPPGVRSGSRHSGRSRTATA